MTSTNEKAPIGVLLMAYGGPASLDELPGYLSDIRSGRPTGKAVVEEMRHNYQQIGGKSPLLEFTKIQGKALEDALNANGANFKVYLGMRHWSPWIEETVRDMITDGIQKVVALVLAPHFSNMGTTRYFQKIDEGQAMYRGTMEVEIIKSYQAAPKYIQALVNRVKEGIESWPEGERDDVHVILSAHSLPTRILKMRDPYQDQLFESARLIVAGAGLREDQWSWSYQSAGRSPEPWLGPQLEEHIKDLAEKGVKKVVNVPIGFVSDHVEILFDIDLKAKSFAEELGIKLVRPPALNDDPLFIGALAELVNEKAAGWLDA